MKRMLINATYDEELRVASVEGQKLINFDIETITREQRRGNIYKSIITRVEYSLEACFVNYAAEKHGFLPFREIDPAFLAVLTAHKGRDLTKLGKALEIIVQVDKDERGNKGAALTGFIALPGRYLVLMPNSPKSGGVSRRIEGEERDELKAILNNLDIPEGMSVILRTAALGRTEDELNWDLGYLKKLWAAIQHSADTTPPPFLIYQESSLIIRSIRDHFNPSIAEILVDTEAVYQQSHQFMLDVMPAFADRIKLYRDDVPLFSRFLIEHQIQSAYSRVVKLPSGGSIVIDHAEALTAIDVNSAKANKGADIESTALATNMEAAEEVSRQMRLRDLGGLVIVDFIDMENQKNQRDLENHFKNHLSIDRARIQMSKISKFGLIELSRQRLQQSLNESTSNPCPRCNGVGYVRNVESSAIHILRIMQEEIIKYGFQISELRVQVPVDVATYLLNELREDIALMENKMKVNIILIPNSHYFIPEYKITRINGEQLDEERVGSYNLLEIPEASISYKPLTAKTESLNIPQVHSVVRDKPVEVAKNSKLIHGLQSILRGTALKVFTLFKSRKLEVESKKYKKKQKIGNKVVMHDHEEIKQEPIVTAAPPRNFVPDLEKHQHQAINNTIVDDMNGLEIVHTKSELLKKYKKNIKIDNKDEHEYQIIETKKTKE